MGTWSQQAPRTDINSALDDILAGKTKEVSRVEEFDIKQNELLQQIDKTMKTIKEQNDEIIGDEF